MLPLIESANCQCTFQGYVKHGWSSYDALAAIYLRLNTVIKPCGGQRALQNDNWTLWLAIKISHFDKTNFLSGMKLGPHISLANNGLLQTCIFLFSPVRSHHFAWPGIPLGRTDANELCKIKDNLDATENPEKMVPPTRPRAPSKVKARSYSIWS